MNATDQGQQVDELATDQVNETTAKETLTVNEPVAPAKETIANPPSSEQLIAEEVNTLWIWTNHISCSSLQQFNITIVWLIIAN